MKKLTLNEFFHDFSHYFAIGFNKKYNLSNIVLWEDEDTEVEYDYGYATVVRHAFTEVRKDLYIDAYGLFTDIRQRKDEFTYNSVDLYIYDIFKAKKRLTDLDVVYTQKEIKDQVRDFLNTHVLVFDWYDNSNNIIRLAVTDIIDYKFYCAVYNTKTQQLGKMVHVFSLESMYSVTNVGFLPVKI